MMEKRDSDLLVVIIEKDYNESALICVRVLLVSLMKQRFVLFVSRSHNVASPFFLLLYKMNVKHVCSQSPRDDERKCLDLLATLVARGTRGATLVDEGLVDMGDNTATGDGGLDKGVELLISANGQQKMAGRDALHLEILARVTGELEHLGGKVLHDGGSVHGGGGTDTLLGVHTLLEEAVNTTDGELKVGALRARHGRALGGRGLATLATLAALYT